MPFRLNRFAYEFLHKIETLNINMKPDHDDFTSNEIEKREKCVTFNRLSGWHATDSERMENVPFKTNWWIQLEMDFSIRYSRFTDSKNRADIYRLFSQVYNTMKIHNIWNNVLNENKKLCEDDCRIIPNLIISDASLVKRKTWFPSKESSKSLIRNS